jgi:DNA-binding response OmpR family regulator
MTNEPKSPVKVLIVDDDEKLMQSGGRTILAARGFEVESEGDGAPQCAASADGEYSLVVLDVMLPGLDGFEVLRRLARRQRRGPRACPV